MVWREGIVACVLDEVKQRKLTKLNSFQNSTHNGPYARKKKKAPTGNECYNVVFFMDFTFDL